MVIVDIELVIFEDWMEWFLGYIEVWFFYVVEDENGNVVVWISFEIFYGRFVYNKIVEVSIYIDEVCCGKGVGLYLLQEVFCIVLDFGICLFMVFIFGYNKLSLKLFEKYGFVEWGLFFGIVEMDGKRYDLKILGRELL